MPVRSTIIYNGEKSCEVKHEPSSSTFLTDAPLDNTGLGRWFSPTDLVGASMGSCMMTIMAIAAEKKGINLTGSKATVDKEMMMNPRRIGKLEIIFNLPNVEIIERETLEKAALACPVKQSLHPDVQVLVTFHWNSI